MENETFNLPRDMVEDLLKNNIQNSEQQLKRYRDTIEVVELEINESQDEAEKEWYINKKRLLNEQIDTFTEKLIKNQTLAKINNIKLN